MPIQDSPWKADIEARFTDEATQEAVDRLWRERVQPRMTQLEQERAAAEAQYAQTEDARQLMEAFQSNPVKTFNDVRSQLIGLGYTLEEAQAGAEQMAADAAAAAPAEPAAPTADPRLEEMYSDWQQQRELAAYDQMIENIVNDPRNSDINPNRLHLYVSAAEGNFDRALELYRKDALDERNRILMDYGIDPATATPVQRQQADDLAAHNQAPPAMGQAAGGTNQVPTTPDYRSQGLSPQDALHRGIEEAAAGMMRGSRNAPPIS